MGLDDARKQKAGLGDGACFIGGTGWNILEILEMRRIEKKRSEYQNRIYLGS